jgi:hypothetical protein
MDMNEHELSSGAPGIPSSRGSSTDKSARLRKSRSSGRKAQTKAAKPDVIIEWENECPEFFREVIEEGIREMVSEMQSPRKRRQKTK